MPWPKPTTAPLWINSSVGSISPPCTEANGYGLCVPLLPTTAVCCRLSARASSPSMASATETYRHCFTPHLQLQRKKAAVARQLSVVSCAYYGPSPHPQGFLQLSLSAHAL